MVTPLKKTALHELISKPVLFDANIFMVGISERISDERYSFENMKQLYIIPLFESFTNIYIHEEVYKELDDKNRTFVDIGIKENGLVHLSQLAERFISDPTEVVSIHQHVMVRVMNVDYDRKRIQLSMIGVQQD